MAGGYTHKPDGTEGVGGILKQLQAQVNTLRGGAGIRSAILRGVQMLFQDEDGNRLGVFGTRATERIADGDITTDNSYGIGFYNPQDQSPLFIASVFQSDGSSYVQAGAGNSSSRDALDLFIGSADRLLLMSNDLEIRSGGALNIFELPTTSSSGNLYIETPGTLIMRQTSGRKYKTDIADADVDPEDVLALAGRTWVDKGALERGEPGHIRRNVGFIAEELDELPSLRQFVVYDEDGAPDGIDYDRLTVALLAVLKDNRKRLDDLEARVTALEKPKKGKPS